MNINVNILIIIMGIIAIIYSYTGGLKSVLWTDFIQGSVLLIGVTFGLIFLVMQQVFSGAARLRHLLGFTGALALVFVLRLLIYGYGYVRGRSAGRRSAATCASTWATRSSASPSRGSPSGRAATTSTRSSRT